MLLRCERLEPPMSQMGHSRPRRTKPHLSRSSRCRYCCTRFGTFHHLPPGLMVSPTICESDQWLDLSRAIDMSGLGRSGEDCWPSALLDLPIAGATCRVICLALSL
jgi:hypothetical protein